MWSILVITCIIFQTAIAIFLLNEVRTGVGIDKHLRAVLAILLVHLTTKFLLLAVLKDNFLYTQIPTGFGLAYGPLLLVIARSILGRPLRPRVIFLQFTPFLLISLVYLCLVVAGAMGSISRSAIAWYAAWYEWLVIASILAYPIYVNRLLRKDQTAEGRLAIQIGNILLIGISAGLLLAVLHLSIVRIPGFDLRLLPYLCFSAIPVLILRYRLRKTISPPDTPARATFPAVEKNVPLETVPVETVDKRYEKSGIDAAKLDEYEAVLIAFMKKSRIYLDADLSLEGLASRMKMPKHHLTQVLNDRVMKNFYTYINEYRIAEAVTRIKDHPKEVNILSLAFDCGFNSRSSFNNYFKKITGHTPSAYRKERLETPLLIPSTSPSI